MAFAIKKFRISPSKLSQAQLEGFYFDQEAQQLVLEKDAIRHTIMPFRLDSGTNGCIWGRYIMDITLPSCGTFVVHYYASDMDIPHYEGASQLIGMEDGLLYEQKGRYLFLWIQVFGVESCSLRQVSVWTPSDPFMGTFPQIYREHGGFFHRYMSVFSSIYMDFQDKIDALHELVDVERAPKEMLPHIGNWLGISFSEQLFDEATMRAILREAAFLHGYKGSKMVISRLAELIVGEPCIVIERSVLKSGGQITDLSILNRLYGNSVFDYTILIPGNPDNELCRKLTAMLQQFQPVRTSANLVFLQNSCVLGAYTYLDVNAILQEQRWVTLDESLFMDGGACLK